MEMIKKFKSHLARARAEGAGVGKSFVRLIKAARDIKNLTGLRQKGEPFRPAQPIAGAYVRMLDGKPMQFFTDGSLRHVLPGMKPGKALRKALKRQRQRQRAESARRATLQPAL